MMQAAPRLAPNFLGPEFNRFLFAMVGTDRQGSPLSVVSCLARLDLDAWAEAAALARLPRDAAISKLSAVLRKYPEIPQLTQEAGAIATRLIALLPGSPTPKRAAGIAGSPWAAASGAGGLGMLIAMALLLGLFAVSETTSHAPPRAVTTSAPATPPITPR